MDMVDFSHRLATEYGVSTVVEEKYSSRRITAEFVDVPLRTVIETVARRSGMSVHFTDGVYYLGQVQAGAKVTLVAHVPGIAGDEVKPLIESCLTAEGRTVVLTDGTVIVADTSEVVDRVRRLIDDLRKVEPGSVALQFFVVSWSDDALKQAGIDAMPSASLAANLSAKASGEFATGLEFDSDALAVLRASWERSGVAILQKPLFFVVDGSEVEFSRKDRIPYVAGSTTTDSKGASRTQTTVTFSDVGFTLSAKCRKVRADALRVDLSIVSSRMVDRVQGVPVIASDDLRQTSVLKPGGVQMVAEFSAQSDRVEASRGLPWISSKESTRATYQVFAYPVFVGHERLNAEPPSVERSALAEPTPEAEALPGAPFNPYAN